MLLFKHVREGYPLPIQIVYIVYYIYVYYIFLMYPFYIYVYTH